MGVPGNVFQRAPLEVTSHVRSAGVRVLSFAVEDEHALTQRVAVLTVGDVAELHRSLGAWLEASAASDVPRLVPQPSKVTVIEFRKRVLCIACGGEHTPGACGAGAA